MMRASHGRFWCGTSAAIVLLCAAGAAEAQTVVAQSGPNPIVINQTATTDNVVVLPAAAAERLSSTYVDTSQGRPKYLWLSRFAQPNDYLTWTVSLRSAARYRVTALLNPGASGQSFNLLVDGVQAASFTPTDFRWDKVAGGTIALPAGRHTLTLRRATSSGSASIKSIELLRESDGIAYDSRVAAFRQAPERFTNQDYGLMFQYGAWGAPRSGNRKTLDQQAADFNVPAFVDMVKSTGAKYVLWSMTWWTYQMGAPIAEVDGIVGNGDRTATRDVVGDIAKALKAQGINFYLYYHTGQDSHLGYNSTDWWRAQNWPDAFTTTGFGDRSTFFRNWASVIGAIGRRYGDALDGWFFDDGMVYYPGAFEALGAAARAGNPNRLVSYNSWYAPSYTDFQDVSFGEICRSSDADFGGNGRYLRGAEKGQLAHCMEMMENDWGISGPNQGMFGPNNTAEGAYNLVASRVRKKVPTSFNMMMYEDGTVHGPSLAALRGMKALFDEAQGCNFGCARWNNDNAAITYTGTWARSTNRSVGDFGNDVHATQANGDSLKVNFIGSGIRLFMPKFRQYGEFEVLIDGVSQGAFSAFQAGDYTPRQQTFAKSGLQYGSHTLEIVKRGGEYMQLDFLDVDQSITRINDNDPSIVKSGSWGSSRERGEDDFNKDVSYTTADGASLSYAFNGTGVQLIMPLDPNQGDVEFFIDGQSQGRVSTRGNYLYRSQHIFFSKKDLAPGSHTVAAVKRGGSYMQLDAIETTGN